jgi:hypothetical protein
MRCGCPVADPPDDPAVVEAVDEVTEHPVELLAGAVALEQEHLLRAPAHEARHAPVALRLSYEGRAKPNSQCLELVLECVRDELAAVIMKVRAILGDAAAVAAFGEMALRPRALDSLESRAAQGGTDT